jgi:hypothetical protein
MNSAQYFLQPVEVTDISDVVSKLPDNCVQMLHLLFNEEFINREGSKMIYYYGTHPEKRPRDLRHWSIALIRWLENAWLKTQVRV